MTTIEGRAFLLKEANREIKTAFDLAELCWMMESNEDCSRLLREVAVEWELSVVVLIRLEQHRLPLCHLQMHSREREY
jgi:hypothetical protein